MAAQLACGSTAALSHRSAGWIYELVETFPCVEVTTSDRRSRRTLTLTVYRSMYVERRGRRGFMVTTPPRTLTDLASCLDEGALERSLDRALNRGLTTADRLAGYLREPRNRNRPGTAALREMVALRIGARPIESDLETLLFRLLRKHGVPLPVPQFEVRTRRGLRRIDFAYVEQRVAIELDGWSVHGTKTAFEADHVRDAELRAIGWQVLRLTWEQIRAEPSEVAIDCARALGLAPCRWRDVTLGG
jgi:very-short-patch-repair endonuclease